MSLTRRLAAALVTLVIIASAADPAVSQNKTDQSKWPTINGMLLINRNDQSRTLDARVGKDPFAFQDPKYRCDGVHRYQGCFVRSATCVGRRTGSGHCTRFVVKATKRHNELLGGHGNDTIYAGPNGDVVWADFKPNGPTAQVDVVTGGDGRDFIYASHGKNTINGGRGNDWIKAHWGYGSINCGSGYDKLVVSHRNQPLYKISNCEIISHKGVGPT